MAGELKGLRIKFGRNGEERIEVQGEQKEYRRRFIERKGGGGGAERM